MRLLFDQNLSYRLVRDLATSYADSAHVKTLGLDATTDRDIWTYAGEEEAFLVLPNLDG